MSGSEDWRLTRRLQGYPLTTATIFFSPVRPLFPLSGGRFQSVERPARKAVAKNDGLINKTENLRIQTKKGKRKRSRPQNVEEKIEEKAENRKERGRRKRRKSGRRMTEKIGELKQDRSRKKPPNPAPEDQKVEESSPDAENTISRVARMKGERNGRTSKVRRAVM